MNGKQAAKKAAKRIEELEYMCVLQANDIQQYVATIHRMIEGGSPCDTCEERKECQLKAKEEGKGCAEWWLAFPEKDEKTANTAPADLPLDGDSGDEVRDVPTGQLRDGEGHSEAQGDGSGAV